MCDILTTEQLGKAFEKRGNKVNALSNVNLKIEKGDYISLVGPSGSGKTTLLNVLGCLDKPTSGTLTFEEDLDVSKMSERELSIIRAYKIGFIFQSFNLIPILNAIENVELPMERTKVPKAERRKKAEELLRRVGLSKRMNHRPTELSAGEQQRVAIARALANDPILILADEPTGNLDSKNGRHIMKILAELNEKMGTTIIIVTHDDQMARLTRKIINLKDGRVTKISNPKEEQAILKISKKLEISQKKAKLLIGAGYDKLEKLIELSEEDLTAIKQLNKKQSKHIFNRINRYRKRATM